MRRRFSYIIFLQARVKYMAEKTQHFLWRQRQQVCYEVPQKLLDQLKDGGRLVVVEGQGNAGVARIYRRQGDGFYGQTAFNSAVMPLPGFEKAEEFVF